MFESCLDAIDDVVNTEKVIYFNRLRIEDYPWLYYILAHDQIFHKHWAIYMSYLYETIFDLEYKGLNFPKLDCVYKHPRICDEDDHQKRKNLQYWVKYFGLIVWSRDNLNDIRSEYFYKKNQENSFYDLVLEAHGMNTELYAARKIPFRYLSSFMTRFMVDIAYKYAANLSINTKNEWQYRAFSGTLLIIEEYRYDNYVRKRYKLFESLSYLIMKIEYVIKCKFLLLEYLAGAPVNAGYINQTIRIFRRYQPKQRRSYLIALLRKIIIKRAETWLEGDSANSTKARFEIKKLAHNALFHKDTLGIIWNSTNYSIASQMTLALYKIRNDWSVDSSLLKRSCLSVYKQEGNVSSDRGLTR